MKDDSLFTAALEKSTPEERRAFLDDVCGNNSAQRERIERLLVGHQQSTGILDHLEPTNSDPSIERRFPTELGPGELLAQRYKLIEEIGEGGMGAVWVAEQTQPVRRKVAIKFVKAGMDSKAVVSRFQVERQALAMMDHPNIAKVLDGGATESARPYFVMEYVQGTPITSFCDDRQLTLSDRLDLFILVCQAVQHAHQKGIIHRDLKPSNILVSSIDGKPVPKVIDFGLAKTLHEPLIENSLHTGHGQMMGTPQYMSPEQADFKNFDLDTRTDVYALGVILYELLTGSTPIEKNQIQPAGLEEVRKIIREIEPPKPSARLSKCESLAKAADRRRVEPARLVRLITGELDWIVMKCLEKERSRRYDTADGLARDIRRFLADEPVEACPPSHLYQLQKLLRKYRMPLLTAGAFTGLLLACVIGLSLALIAVNNERSAKEIALNAKDIALRSEAKRRKQARTALDTMTSQIIVDWLSRQPVLLPAQKMFIEQALRQYEEFAVDTGQDEESRVGVAGAYLAVARIRIILADWKGAEAAAIKSRDLFATLVADFPNHANYRKDLAYALHLLAQVYESVGSAGQAVTVFEHCVQVRKGLVADFPEETDYRDGLAITLSQLAVSLKNLNRRAEAEAICMQAVELHQQLVAQAPTDASFRYHLAFTLMSYGGLLETTDRLKDALIAHRKAVELFSQLALEQPTSYHMEAMASCQSNLALVLQANGNLQEAETNFRASESTRRQLVAQFPTVADYRRRLAITINNLGILFKDTKRLAEAEQYYRESASIHKKLSADFPDVANHQNEAAGACNNVARLLMLRSDFAGAQALLKEAVPYHLAALRINSNHPSYRNFYRINRLRMAETLLALKDHETAAITIEEFFQYATDPPRNAYNGATLFSECARLAKNDQRLDEPTRKSLESNYADRAMKSLQRAVTLKAKEAAQLKSDKSLDPLRERSDFKKLLAEVEPQR